MKQTLWGPRHKVHVLWTRSKLVGWALAWGLSGPAESIPAGHGDAAGVFVFAEPAASMSVGPWVPAELTESTPAMGFSAFPEPAGGSVRPAAEDADIRPCRPSGPSGAGCVQAQGSDHECGKCLQQQLHTTRALVYE